MLYLTPPSTPPIRAAIDAGEFGMLLVPGDGRLPRAGAVCAIDNGCFTPPDRPDRFDPARWWRFVSRCAEAGRERGARILFAVAPDVVADAAATLARSTPWLGRIRGLGLPVAFVAQDGQERLPVPWPDLDVLFIGGSTRWKLGLEAADLAGEAIARGVPVHLGRANSGERILYAKAIGAATADGTFLAKAPDTNLPRLRAMIGRLDHPAQGLLL